jgi:predicted O-methyltransferase YrrM
LLLKRKDIVVSIAFSALFAGAALAVGRIAGSQASVGVAWLSVTTIAALLLVSSRRTRDLFERQSKEQSDTYHQIEAFISLTSTLNFRHPLPPMREWAISPDFAIVLVGIIRECRPRRILELGGGVSTLVAAYCLEEFGRGSIVSLDHDFEFADAIRRNLMRHGLEAAATVLHAPLKAVVLGSERHLWYDCDVIPPGEPFDLVIVDGPPAGTQTLARYPALPLLMKRFSADAVILLDDADRCEEREIIWRWLREFPGFIREDVPTEKGATVLRRLAGDSVTTRLVA